MQNVVVDGKAGPKPGKLLRLGVKCEVDCFTVALVHEILKRNLRISRSPAIRHLSHPMQPETARGYHARGCDPNVVSRQNAAVVFVRVHDGSSHTGLKILCSMELIGVVPQRSCILTKRNLEVLVPYVSEE